METPETDLPLVPPPTVEELSSLHLPLIPKRIVRNERKPFPSSSVIKVLRSSMDEEMTVNTSVLELNLISD